MNFNFGVTCFSETWLDAQPSEWINYKSIDQARNHSKGAGVSIYANKSLNFKLRRDLSINSRDVESLSTEIVFVKEQNT